jgi:hypothetical protein
LDDVEIAQIGIMMNRTLIEEDLSDDLLGMQSTWREVPFKRKR